MKKMNLKRLRLLKHKKKNSGFTLIELLAVLTILAIVVGIAGPAIYRQVARGKSDAARAQIASIEKALNNFYLDCGFFPKTEPGLDALVNPPSVGRQCKNYDPAGYFEKGSVPADPWDLDYIYESPGKNRPGAFDLYSVGPDGEAGTEDDIVNWE